MSTIDDEWNQYLLHDDFDNNTVESIDENVTETIDVPKCDDLYISTKTKVLFLNQEVDIKTVFWDIPIISYSEPREGVIKKQMKTVPNKT